MTTYEATVLNRRGEIVLSGAAREYREDDPIRFMMRSGQLFGCDLFHGTVKRRLDSRKPIPGELGVPIIPYRCVVYIVEFPDPNDPSIRVSDEDIIPLEIQPHHKPGGYINSY